MNYEYQKAYMNFNQTYGQYFGSLIDTSKSLKEQSCPFDANGGTWDDYFKQSAETNLTQLSAVYAKAIAEGYTSPRTTRLRSILPSRATAPTANRLASLRSTSSSLPTSAPATAKRPSAPTWPRS